MTEREAFAARDALIKAFYDFYRENGAAFPSECTETEYRRRLEAAYPIHPELFDRLNNDWGSLDKFQRTRGILRLMASVIHCLWERGDKSLMILPSSVPLDDPIVQSRITRLLEEKWDAIISADIDGETSRPLAIDRETRTSPATRRRGALHAPSSWLRRRSTPAPTPASTTDESGWGAPSPGRLQAASATRYAGSPTARPTSTSTRTATGYSVQPSVTRTAEDRAKYLEADEVWHQLIARMRRDRERGPFAACTWCPMAAATCRTRWKRGSSSSGPDYAHHTFGDSRARGAAEEILTRRGQQPRIHRKYTPLPRR